MKTKLASPKSPYVRDFGYNMGITNEKNKFSSYEELSYFLDKEFIPSNIACKRRKNKATNDDEIYLSIQFNKITSLKCSEEEIGYILEYLRDRNIRVCGRDNVLEGEYENYDFFFKHHFPIFPKAMSSKEQEELFKKLQEYKTTKDSRKSDIIKQIANGSLRLIPYITYKYSILTGFDINVLNSYGCEGLLEAIDKFEPSHGNKFSTFAVIYIKNRVRNGMRDLRGFDTGREFYSDFIRCKNIVEKSYSEKLGINVTMYDEPTMIEDIIILMKETCMLSPSREKCFRNKLYLLCQLPYEEQNELISDINLENIVINKELQKIIRELLKTLPEREREVLKLRYGFDGEEPKTLEAIGKIYGLTKERIRVIEKKAIERLKHPSRIKKLKGYY